MIAHETLVKMLRREARVTRPVKRFHLRLPVDGDPLAGSPSKPPVENPGIAIVLVPLAPVPERPLTDPQKLRCFRLAELRRYVTAQNVQKLDHPHTLSGFRPAHPNPPKPTGQIVCYLNRIYRVLAIVTMEVCLPRLG